jgi:hypothetical protein
MEHGNDDRRGAQSERAQGEIITVKIPRILALLFCVGCVGLVGWQP